MKHKQNLHTHTTYVDGKDRPEEILLRALERGMEGIGFSEYAYIPYSEYPRQLTAEKMEQYREEILDLKKKYAGRIDVFCGLEYDFYSELETDRMDYLIGSVHYLACGEEIKSFDYGLEKTLDYIRDYFDGDPMRFAKAYFETVARFPEKKKVDVLGHFDLIVKNNEMGRFLDVGSKAYLDLGLEAIHALKGRIPLFEVNTGAISRGYTSSPYPQIEFLKELRDCGFGAVITSDCHNMEFLDCRFEEAELLLREAGFRSKWILTDGGFREVDL